MSTETLLRPKITISKYDNSVDYFVHDGFSPPVSGARVIELSVEDKELETGQIMVKIEDSDGVLNSNIGNGNKLKIQLGSTQAGLTNYVAGFVRQVEISRSDTGVKEVILHGYTNPIRTEERILNFFRIAKRATSDNESPDTSDTTMTVSELFKDVFEDTDVYPIGGPLLSFTRSGVTSLSDFMASIKEPFVTMKDILDRLVESAGAIWGIDGSDDVFLRYTTLTHSGITIKNTVGASDDASKVGYFTGPWSFVRSIKKGDGFANRLYGRGGTQFHLDVDKFTDTTTRECHSVDRAMQFTAKAPDLTSIGLILSRVGTLSADIDGEVRYDDGNTPDGDILATFSIFKDLVGTSASTINRITVNAHRGIMQVGTKYWIVLKKQGDASNHYRWHSDSGTSGVNATRSASTWTVNTGSFTLTHRTWCSRRVMTEASSPVSIDKYDVIEDVIDAPHIKEGRAMDLLLTSILTYSARQKVIFSPRKIWGPTVPINAGKLVRLTDTTSGIDMDTEVKSVKYHFKADESGFGTRYVEVELIGFES